MSTEEDVLTDPISSDVQAVQVRLDVWKKALLDLARRNRVLYFSSSRAVRIRVVAPALADLYQKLILDERKLAFPTPADESVEEAELEPDGNEVQHDRIRQGDLEVDFDGHWVKDVVNLQKRLYRLRTDAQTMIHEQGINTLHMAFGLLEWSESREADERVTSPLVLAPISLSREKNRPYECRVYEDGDVVLNPTLLYKLEHDFGMDLPSLDPYDGFGEEPNLAGFFAAVEEVVRDKGWSVIKESWISHFAFQKLVMYEDLNEPSTAAEGARHAVIATLCEVGRDSTLPSDGFGVEAVEAKFDSPDAFPVVDADGSQLEVMSRVSSGVDLVVQGPPGTGKSQTIVNLISAAVRDRKTVLFVSEKKAALDVVYQRLEHAGLGELCLEMHSNKTNKRQVVAELYRAATSPPRDVEADVEGEFQERRRVRDRLRAYVDELHLPRDGRGRTAFLVQGQLAKLDAVPLIGTHLPVSSVRDLSAREESELLMAVQEVGASPVWTIAEAHPWAGAAPEEGSFFPVPQLRETLGSLLSALQRQRGMCASTDELCATRVCTQTLEEGERVSTILDALALTPKNADVWLLGLPSDRFLTVKQLLTDWSEVSSSLSLDLQDLDAAGGTSLLSDVDLLEELVARYLTIHRTKKFRYLSAQYRSDRDRLQQLCGRKIKFEPAVTLLEFARWVATEQEKRAKLESELRSIVGSQLSDREVGSLVSQLSWATSLRACWDGESVPEALLGRIAADPHTVADVARDLVAQCSELDGTLEPLSRWLKRMFPAGVRGREIGDIPLAELSTLVESLQSSADRLAEWLAFAGARSRAGDLGLTAFLDECAKRGIGGGMLHLTLQRGLSTQWLTEVYRDAETLAHFNFSSHEQLIDTFRTLDVALKDTATRVTLARARQRIPSPPPANEAKLLQKEYAKKRRHLPLRRLLPGVPRVLQGIKPCLLMSPLSVASYLPRGAFAFDLVIFDEASQVMPADAIGSILRGKQVVVLGDSRQLPPTNFFQVVDGDETDEDVEPSAADAAAFESILDIARGYLSESHLLWHYRSRDERLIAFSNRRFYEGQLITFPSAFEDGDTGVRFVYVEQGWYDRGATRTNREEAKRIAELVLDHFERHPGRSLGVIALSLPQRDAIDLELRRRRQSRPDLDPLFAEDREEPFFVKNLEAVQGDERDEIILSVGYGPSEPGGNPTLQFGPINREGGQRRLNVAITRARIRTTLVTSIQPHQLDSVAGSRWEGPRALAEYHRYAARGGRFEGEGEDLEQDPESDFEWAVYDALRARGFKVDCQIGSSGFRIDLGIRHPQHDGRYVLGIECDGVAYHSAKTVRDRDRLRQEVLEGLGWNIHRVWSTDWVRSREVAEQRIVEKLDRLVKLGDAGIRRVAPRRTPTSTRISGAEAKSDVPITADDRGSDERETMPEFSDRPVEFAAYRAYEASRDAPGARSYAPSSRAVAEHLEALVKVEGPVHEELVFRQLARVFGFQRLGSQIRTDLGRGAMLALQSARVERRGEFLWWAGQGEVQPRRHSAQRSRVIQEICDEELMAGVAEVLRQAGATRRDELAKMVLKAFGFDRTSSELSQRSDDAIEHLLISGRCGIAEGYVVLREV